MANLNSSKTGNTSVSQNCEYVLPVLRILSAGEPLWVLLNSSLDSFLGPCRSHAMPSNGSFSKQEEPNISTPKYLGTLKKVPLILGSPQIPPSRMPSMPSRKQSKALRWRHHFSYVQSILRIPRGPFRVDIRLSFVVYSSP